MDFKTDYTIIGIDGGGTHTRGILFREGEIKAKSTSGTTRIGAVGVGESCERTLNVIIDLCHQAELDSNELDAVVVGLAGVWLDEEKKRSAALLKTLGRSYDVKFNDLIVTSDAELAIEGAFEGSNGSIVIVGTGSIALARVDKGKLHRCGGWGIEIDDEGSGAWIGREGLTAIVRAIDGRGKKTALVDIIEELIPSIDMSKPRTIVKAYSERAFQYHMLTPTIMKCAEDGDAVSLEIINRAAMHLTELPLALQDRFSTKTVPVALLGGIIDADTLLSQLLQKEIKQNKRLRLVEPKGSALDGALSIGAKLIEMGE